MMLRSILYASCILLQEDYPEVWISTDSESSEMESSQPLHDRFPNLRLMYTFLLFWQFAYKVSSNAIHSLLRFLKYFLLIIGNAFHCHEIREFGEHFPVTLDTLYKRMCINADRSFTNYVVCPKCHSIYLYEDCVIARANGSFDTKRCYNVAYPKHPHRNQRAPCNEVLVKKIRTRSGHKIVPIKVYPYNSLLKQFARLFQRKNFASDCEKWRIRSACMQDGCLGDIYDGAVWKNFNSPEGLNFLTCPYSYLLTLNIDWFQPFDRGVYSVGAIYLTIQNLPRAERFKSENILLIGIIPGPKEPKHTINSYLTPLVVELKQAWDGSLMTSAQGTQVRVRLALSCVSCDIPATRKVVGFLGHNATLGCNQCYKKFTIRVGDENDFSGYDRENWVMRDDEKHRRDVHKLLQEVTKSGLRSSESKFGLRYSVLLGLNYFDPIAFTAVDVMHNLYLGSGKRMVEIWIDMKLIKKDDFTKIDNIIQSFNMPADCGRLPLNLSSSHGAFTASQWKNWIIIYSPVVLKGILPRDHLQCWLLFVRACVLLSKRFILGRDIDTADLYLLQFCRKFEALYGKARCTPNMHLHLHLRDTFKNFGPAHAFWCFPFERYNGLLGSYHTNRKSIEVQVHDDAVLP